MSGRNVREALDHYMQPIQSALLCVTPARLRYTALDIHETGTLRFANASGVELRRRNAVSGEILESVYLLIHEYYELIIASQENEPRAYRVIADGYSYVVRTQTQREIIAFHWHPGQRSHVDTPHVHIGSAVIDARSSDIGKVFSRFHIPTGYITIPQVMRFLLTDFNVVPNRRDWEATLARLI